MEVIQGLNPKESHLYWKVGDVQDQNKGPFHGPAPNPQEPVQGPPAPPLIAGGLHGLQAAGNNAGHGVFRHTV